MRVTTMETIEELGRKKESGLEVEIEWNLTEGEPMVRYYPDGSGYPGSPPEAEIQNVRVTALYFGDEDLVRNRPDWFESLDAYVWEHLETELREEFLEHALEKGAFEKSTGHTYWRKI